MHSDEFRIESDIVGTLPVPREAYYGVQSLRGRENFYITGRPVHPELIRSLAKVKKAAALTNYEAGYLEKDVCLAICQAADEIIEGRWHEQFIVDAVQGGAGTSANMNANEVIANRAGELLGDSKGSYSRVHPNDHVNMAQSTNDVFPTAGKITILIMLRKTLTQLERLRCSLAKKALEFDDIVKVARTQLQDAVPIRLGQSFHAYASVVARDIRRLRMLTDDMSVINLGGTAIGTSINASLYYVHHIAAKLSEVCAFPLERAADLIDATQNLDGFVLVSSIVKTAAVSLSKVANDLRLLSSGPKAGVAEINLPQRQNGSSIMPGKVNPVIPEVVSQVAFNIIGNDLTVTLAAEAGQLELNAFEPVLFYNLFESIETLGYAAETLAENCVDGISANREHMTEILRDSLAAVTALCPYIGYKKASELAKNALTEGLAVDELVLREGLLSRAELDRILDPYALTSPHDLFRRDETRL